MDGGPQRTSRDAGMLRLGSVRGVPILVAPSWLLVALLVAIIYGPLVQDSVTGISRTVAYLASLGFAALFALCILAHELGHTLVSLALGHPVRRVILFMLGGVSEIESEPDRAGREFLIAAAGPLISLVLAAAAWGLSLAFAAHTVFAVLCALLAWSNLVLAAFNLLPGLPLDGGRLLRAVVWACGASPYTGTKVAAWAGRLIAGAVAVSGLLIDRTQAGIGAGIMSIALAAYLWVGATQSLRTAGVLARLPSVRVPELLRPGVLVSDTVSVAEALRQVWENNARGLVLVDSAQRPRAIVDEAMIGSVPADQRPWTSVTSVARPLEPGLMVPVDIDAKGLLDRMQATPAREYLAVDAAGRPAGIITAADFARTLRAARA